MVAEIDKYTYRVTWSKEDQKFVGLCSEFPGLSWLKPAPETALKGIRALVKSTIKDMNENGEFVPEAISSKKFSGKFMVRVPPEVHRHLTLEAVESGVSLNRLVSAKLAQ
jgi:predicted HicB family RNase H-like nuclease